VALRHQVISPDGAVVANVEGAAITLAGTATLDHTITLPQARLWSLKDRALYRLVTQVVVDGAVVDQTETRFGIRTLRFDGATGFFLNDQPVKLLGVCNHQDHAGVAGDPRCAAPLACGADAGHGRQCMAQRTIRPRKPCWIFVTRRAC
jgi:beta-galactosidase